LLAWTFVTAWYLFWGLWLVPYRLLRRGARKRKPEAMRHRELMGTIQGSAVASANAIVASQVVAPSEAPKLPSPTELVADTDRSDVVEELRQHMMAGRLTTDEFEERLGSAHAARTRVELQTARIDLPQKPLA